MIALRKNGQYLNILPGTSVPWEVEDDILDFDYVGQAFSAEFDVPRAGNEVFFNFAGSPENPRNEFKVYTDFEFTTDGFVFWRVNLVLKRSTRLAYTVELSSIPSKLIENREAKLADLITTTIAIADGTYAACIQPFNDELAGDMVFPFMHFYGENTVLRLINNDALLLPAFKVNSLLRQASAAMGYRFKDNYSQSGTDMSRIIYFGNRVIDTLTTPSTILGGSISFAKIANLITVAKYLPDVTFMWFIGEVAKWTGASIVINDDEKLIELRGITREQNTNQVADITERVDPEDVFTERVSNTSFAFNIESDQDTILAQTPTVLAGNYRGEFANEAALAAVGSPVAGDYGFCLTENAYFKFEDFSNDLYLQRYSDALQPYLPTEESKTIPLNLLPVSKDKYLFWPQELQLTIADNGSGKVRIAGFPHSTLIPPTNWWVRFDEPDQGARNYPDIYYDVTATGSNYIDIDLDYSIDLTIGNITARFELNYFIPLIGAALHYPELGRNNPDFKGRIAIWHGMQATIDGLSTYPYASADPYDSEGTLIGNFAFRFFQSNSLLSYVYSAINSFFRSTRILRFVGVRLTERQLRDLFLFKVGRYAAGKFRLKSISTNIGENGPELTDIEGYRI